MGEFPVEVYVAVEGGERTVAYFAKESEAADYAEYLATCGVKGVRVYDHAPGMKGEGRSDG